MKELINSLKSPQMQNIQSIIQMISPKNTNVLIEGEKGTEKGIIAQFIHDLSPRKHDPFISINCSILTESQGNELFRTQDSLNSNATGNAKNIRVGTLFLNEISKLSMLLQTKLFLFLEQKKILQTNDKYNSKSFYVIAATDIDLKKEIEKGNFREDLFYELNIIQLDIPPLRDRQQDIPIFVNFYIEKFNSNFNSHNKIKIMNDNVSQILQYYLWPGNVRELENIIERTILLSKDGYISIEHIPTNIQRCSNENLNLGKIPIGFSLPKTLLEVEKTMIRQAMKKSNNIQIEAAKFLGISRSGLNQKIKKHNFEYYY